MGYFFLPFDVTMDISHVKFISEKSGQTHCPPRQFTPVKVSRVTAPNIRN